MCVALPVTLCPVYLLHRAKIINRVQKEKMSLKVGQFCSRWWVCFDFLCENLLDSNMSHNFGTLCKLDEGLCAFSHFLPSGLWLMKMMKIGSILNHPFGYAITLACLTYFMCLLWTKRWGGRIADRSKFYTWVSQRTWFCAPCCAAYFSITKMWFIFLLLVEGPWIKPRYRSIVQNVWIHPCGHGRQWKWECGEFIAFLLINLPFPFSIAFTTIYSPHFLSEWIRSKIV